MKFGMVGLALLLVGGLILYVMVRRPTVPANNITGPSTSNALFSVLGSAASNILSSISFGGNKVGAPSAVTGATSQPIINQGTYLTGDNASNLEQEGNTLVNTDTGNAVIYGTD